MCVRPAFRAARRGCTGPRTRPAATGSATVIGGETTRGRGAELAPPSPARSRAHHLEKPGSSVVQRFKESYQPKRKVHPNASDILNSVITKTETAEVEKQGQLFVAEHRGVIAKRCAMDWNGTDISVRSTLKQKWTCSTAMPFRVFVMWSRRSTYLWRLTNSVVSLRPPRARLRREQPRYPFRKSPPIGLCCEHNR